MTQQPGYPSNQSCSKCSTSYAESFWMRENYCDKTENPTMISICSNCPYVQCKGCSRMTTIEDSVGKCYCSTREFCRECSNGIMQIYCFACNNSLPINVCQKAECSTLARDFFASCQEICSFCLKTIHCTHPTIRYNTDDKPPQKTYCMYRCNGEPGKFCEKWICPGCVELSLVNDRGFMCFEHKDL